MVDDRDSISSATPDEAGRATGFWDGAPVIHAYTRADAIRDGTLVPTTELVPDEPDFAKQAGFIVPVTLTAAVAALVRPTEREADDGQDLKGRLWDVLMMAALYRARARRDPGGSSTWTYPCIFRLAGRDDAPRAIQRTVGLKATVHGGDDGEPVITILLGNED